MEPIASEFLSLPSLLLRVLLLILIHAGMGLLLLPYMLPRNKQGEAITGGSWCFLALPLGWTVLSAATFSLLRTVQLLRLQPSLGSILAAALLALLFCCGFIYRSASMRRTLTGLVAGLRRSRRQVLLSLLGTLLTAALCLLPLVVDSQVVFYAGYGTDALGYIRLTHAVADGTFLKPPPPATDRQLLYQPGRSWVYSVMESGERPGAYFFPAVVTRLAGLNDFQGYLAGACLLLACLYHFTLFFVTTLVRPDRQRVALAGLAALLMAALSFTGNFAHQYFAQCIAVTCLLVAGGVVASVCSYREDLPALAALGGYAVVLTISVAYDFRHGLLAGACLGLASIVPLLTGRRFSLRSFLRAGLMAAGMSAGLLHALPSSRWNDVFSPERRDAAPLTLRQFAEDAGLAQALDYRVVLVCLALALLAGVWRWRQCWHRTEEIRPALTYLGVCSTCTLGAVLALVRQENHWAAMKLLYLFLPAVVLLAFLLLCELAAAATPLRWTTFHMAAAALAVVGVASVASHVVVARNIVRNDEGLIRKDGILTALRQLHPERVKRVAIRTRNVVRYLILVTLLDDSGLPIDSSFTLWREGGGARGSLQKISIYR